MVLPSTSNDELIVVDIPVDEIVWVKSPEFKCELWKGQFLHKF